MPPSRQQGEGRGERPGGRDARPGSGEGEWVASLDRAVTARPVPEDVITWRALGEDAFDRPWRELTETLHAEPGYLAVALVRYPELASSPAILRLWVPKGTPAVYLNALDRAGRLPAPTLLLGRGLYLYVHSLRRQDGQWFVRAEIVPRRPAAGATGAP